MKKALFIDRDGTIIREPEDEQIDSFEKLAFYPGVIRALATLRELTDYEFVMVSNQDGLGTASFPEETFWPVHNFILDTLKGDEHHHRQGEHHPYHSVVYIYLKHSVSFWVVLDCKALPGHRPTIRPYYFKLQI